MKTPELTLSWTSFSWTASINVLVNYGGFPSWEVMNWLHTSQQTPTILCTVNRHPFTLIWKYLHSTACCCLFVLVSVLLTINKCASWVKWLVGTFAASRWKNSCQHSCCVQRILIIDAAPTYQLELDPPSNGSDGCVLTISRDWVENEGDDEMMLEALRILQLASCLKGITSSQHDHYTQDVESYWVWLQVAGVSHCPTICNESVWCSFFLTVDNIWCFTATIARLACLTRVMSMGKDVGWCLSQIIPGISPETVANSEVIL